METFSDFKSISTLIFACGFYRPIYEKIFYHVQFSTEIIKNKSKGLSVIYELNKAGDKN